MAISQAIPLSKSDSDNDKRKRIRNYFRKKWWLWLVAGILLIRFGGIGFILIIGWLAWFFLFLKDVPSDRTIDAWLIDDIKELEERSLKRLNIDRTQLRRDPIIIRGPILWKTPGVPDKDIRWKKGKDKYIRFSINSITIIHLTEYKLSSYQCVYNFMRAVPLNERDDEFYYRDVVAVSTRDESTNYTLPNGILMKHAQIFKLSVSSGDSIQAIVNSSDLLNYTGGTMPDTGLDDAVKALRKVLSETKT